MLMLIFLAFLPQNLHFCDQGCASLQLQQLPSIKLASCPTPKPTALCRDDPVHCVLSTTQPSHRKGSPKPCRPPENYSSPPGLGSDSVRFTEFAITLKAFCCPLWKKQFPYNLVPCYCISLQFFHSLLPYWEKINILIIIHLLITTIIKNKATN